MICLFSEQENWEKVEFCNVVSILIALLQKSKFKISNVLNISSCQYLGLPLPLRGYIADTWISTRFPRYFLCAELCAITRLVHSLSSEWLKHFIIFLEEALAFDSNIELGGVIWSVRKQSGYKYLMNKSIPLCFLYC